MALQHIVLCLSAFLAAATASHRAVAAPATSIDAAQAAQDWVRAKGWRQGFDRGSRRLVVVTSAGFRALPSAAGYVASRQEAFAQAMTDARRQAAEFLGAEVEAALTSRTSVTEVIGDPVLAKALTGVASDEAFQASSELREAVSVVARASISGLYACQTFESSDGKSARIAVVAAVSPDSAAAVLSGKSGECDRSGLEGWLRSVDDPALACTFGVRFAYDRDCVLRPVAFGQAAVPPGALGMDAATELAKGNAIKQLQDTIGGALASRSLSSSVSETEEGSAMPPAFRDLDKFESSIQAYARSDFGFTQVGRRTVKDPVTGASLAVVALTVNPGVPASSGDSPAAAVMPAGDCPSVPAEMAKSIRQTRASGTGPTKAAALSTALLEAVRREGAMVKGNSLLERQYQAAVDSAGDEVREKTSSRVNQSSSVQTYANGFVYSYEVLRETDEGNLWEVEVCANLVRFDPKNPRFGLPPTVAVMPMACVPANVKVQQKPVPCEEVTSPCEQALDAALAASGSFIVLAERDMRDLGVVRGDIARRVASGRSEEMEALKLGRELTADFIVLGKVTRAEFTGAPGQRPQQIAAGDTAFATVSARMVNVASGEVAWSKESTVTLKGRDILLVRAGRELKDPAEAALSPLQLAVSRAAREVAASLAEAFPPKGTAAAGGRSPVPAGTPVKIVRVAGSMVTLDASNPAVAVGARLDVNLLVDVVLPGGRTEIDRDQVATIEVVSVNGALAKARVVEGDPSLIDPGKCEAVPKQATK